MTKQNFNLMHDAAIKACFREVPDLAKTIAEEIFGISFGGMTIHPTEFPPFTYNGKTNISDVLFQLVNGGFLDIEAHNGPVTREESGQVQIYTHRLGIDTAKKGHGFHLLPIYLMMLINDESRNYHCLISEEVNFKEGINEFLGNHVHIKFVYLSYTKKLMEEKGINGMSVAELLLYIFAYGIPEKIEERKEQVIKDMISFGARFFDRRRGSIFTAKEYEELMRQKQIAKEERYRRGIEKEAIVAEREKNVEAKEKDVQAKEKDIQAEKQMIEAQKIENEIAKKEMKEKELELIERENKVKLLEKQYQHFVFPIQ